MLKYFDIGFYYADWGSIDENTRILFIVQSKFKSREQFLLPEAQSLMTGVELLLDKNFQVFFNLPYQFKVPDMLFHEKLSDQHGYLIELGLLLGELSPESMMYSFELRQKYAGPSMNDCFALALAKQEQCPLLTGDMALRKAAEKEAILVQGTLWVVEQLVTHNVLSVEEAQAAYDKMAKAGRRL